MQTAIPVADLNVELGVSLSTGHVCADNWGHVAGGAEKKGSFLLLLAATERQQ